MKPAVFTCKNRWIEFVVLIQGLYKYYLILKLPLVAGKIIEDASTVGF